MSCALKFCERLNEGEEIDAHSTRWLWSLNKARMSEARALILAANSMRSLLVTRLETIWIAENDATTSSQTKSTRSARSAAIAPMVLEN